MTGSSPMKPNQFFQWLQHNSVLVLTILGILLYTAFYLPAVYFYGRLGTNPSEVGLTYSTVLSGAPVGILITIIVFVVVVGLIVGVIVDILTLTFLIELAIRLSLNRGLSFG